MSKSKQNQKELKERIIVPDEEINITPPVPDEEINITPPVPDEEINITPPVPDEEINITPPVPDEEVNNTSNNPIREAVVNGCLLLNVREKPSKTSEVVTRLKKGDTVLVNLSESTDNYFKITKKNGIAGFCVREFILVN